MRAPILPRRQPQHPSTENRLAPPRPWPKLIGVLAVVVGLVGGLAAGLGAGCVIADPDYCDSNVKCAAQGEGTQMVCNLIRHTCVPMVANGCGQNSDCKDPARPRCDLLSMACTPCRTDEPMSCSSVSTSARCTELGSGETRCVECGKNADCKDAARPICDLSTNQCRGCQRHSDCEGDVLCHTGAPCKDSLVCIKEGDEPGLGGRCALNGTGMDSRVLYMSSPDPASMNPDATTLCNRMDAQDGRTPDTAVCRMLEALAKAKSANIRYIRIIGDWDFDVGTHMLSNEGPYHLIGAPRAGKTKNRGLVLRGSFVLGKNISMTFDQVDLKAVFKDTSLITCNGQFGTLAEPSSLRILGSTLTGSSEPGASFMNLGAAAVLVADCSLFIDRSVIGVTKKSDLMDAAAGAHFHGIRYVADTTAHPRTLTIQNSIIAGNILTGIRFDGLVSDSVKVRIQFNTLVRNGRRMNNGAGAIRCPDIPTPSGAQFLNNVIFDNSVEVGKSQFYGGMPCFFHNTVVGESESSSAPGLIKQNFEFGDDLRTTMGTKSDQFVIDKAVPYMNPAGMTEAVPAYDVDGNPRPAGPAADIGATEVKK